MLQQELVRLAGRDEALHWQQARHPGEVREGGASLQSGDGGRDWIVTIYYLCRLIVYYYHLH